jgi:Bifunctional DNA primase/polymerase, N-terminal/Helix-turn-helix domain
MPRQKPFQSFPDVFDVATAGQASEIDASESRLPPEHRFVARHAIHVAENGFSCIPIPPGQKRVFWRNWTRFCSQPPTPKQILKWRQKYPDHGLALPCGWKVIAVDIDLHVPAEAEKVEQLARADLGNTPLMRVGQFPKRALIYRVAPGHVIPSSSVGKVDLIGDNRFLVAFGIHPGTGQPYYWNGETPATVPVADLPAVTPAQVARFMGDASCVQKSPATRAKPASHQLAVDQSAFSSSIGVPSPAGTDQLARDGRDGLLTRLVFRAFGQHDAAEAIADAAWATFRNRADLTRPKRDGRELWSYADALAKSQALLERRKPRPRAQFILNQPATLSWESDRLLFGHRVDQACVAGELTRTDAAVSHIMLAFVSGPDGSCFASCETLAGRVGCRPSSVKKARRQLRRAQLWRSTNVKGGRGLLAHYRPCINSAHGAQTTLDADAGRPEQEGDGN